MPRKTSPTPRHRPRSTRFNEAAARCRGKLGRLVACRRTMARCFNEAAARCRGKLVDRREKTPTETLVLQ